jgi:alcohol dehydrogenase, propanol-preferring
MAPNIPTEMRAVQVVKFNAPYALNKVPVPSQLDPYDLLVKVAVASYCHTDSSKQQSHAPKYHV